MKIRRRDPQALDFGCYSLVNIQDNVTVFGTNKTGLMEASLDEIEIYLLAKPKRGAK